MPKPDARLIGLLLASGRGRRFDSNGRRNKLLAALPDGQSVVVASARALCAALAQVVVVVPSHAPLLEAALSHLPVRLVRNTRAREGMGASIAVGVEAMQTGFPDAAGWVVALGDMPFISPETITLVADALLAAKRGDLSDDGCARAATSHARPMIALPAYRGQRGHPVAFSNTLGSELRALGGDVGASALFERHAVRVIECDDRGILRDIDQPQDLLAAQSESRASEGG